MIIHKSVGGKKTSASIGDDLFEIVVRYFDGDTAKAKRALADVVKMAVENDTPPSRQMRKACYQWVVKPRFLRDPEEQKEMDI